MKKTASGFTLMEMITVMAIATLITIASAPAFMNFARTQRIRGAASNIASALNSARRYAITLNEPKAIYIYSNDYADDEIKNSFLFWETETNRERRLIHRTVWIEKISWDDLNGTEVYELEFTSRGALSGSTGTILLKDTGERTIEITVYNTTGRVKIGELEE